MKTLVVAAHPDDEVLGCGGTIARHAADGDEVRIAILGEGATSRCADVGTGSEGVEELKRQGRAAAEALGVGEPLYFSLPDNRFDTIPLLEVVKIVEALLKKQPADVVYTHHAGDLNIDHRVTLQAVLAATRPTGADTPRRVLAFEVPSSTEWSFRGSVETFRPNVFVDVSTTINAKVEAMKAYRSEIRTFPHPRSEEAIRALAAWRGSSAGMRAAEAFELVRSLR